MPLPTLGAQVLMLRLVSQLLKNIFEHLLARTLGSCLCPPA